MKMKHQDCDRFVIHAGARRRLARWASVAPLALAAWLHLEFAVLATLLPGAAAAQPQVATPPRTLALFVTAKARKDDTAAQQVRGLLRGLADRLQPGGVERALPGAADAAQPLKWLDGLVAEGRTALNNGDWAGALAKFTAAQDLWKGIRPYVSRAQAARIHKGAGVALIGLGRLDEARASLRTSLMLYPVQRSSEYAYSLETRNLFSDVQREVQDAPNATLTVTTRPAGAEVYVDGEFRGFAPLPVERLVAGDHLVVAFQDGYAPASTIVTITGGPAESTVLELSSEGGRDVASAAASFLRAVDRGRGADEEASRLAGMTTASDVVALRVSAEGDSVGITGAHFGRGTVTPMQALVKKDAEFVTGVQKLLTDALAMPSAAGDALPPLDTTEAMMPTAGTATRPTGAEGEEYIVDPDSPLFRDTGKKQAADSVLTKWWFWTAVGVVVVGAGTGIYFLSKKGGDDASTGDLSITINGLR